MKSIITWLKQNITWVFSGIGVFILSLLVSLIIYLFSADPSPKIQVDNPSGNTIIIQGDSSGDIHQNSNSNNQITPTPSP